MDSESLPRPISAVAWEWMTIDPSLYSELIGL
jgi:hypothetical protein